MLVTSSGSTLTAGGWVMLLVGVVALVHGIVLLTPAAARLGGWSGPLLIANAVIMLVNRAVLPMGAGGMTGPGTGCGLDSG